MAGLNQNNKARKTKDIQSGQKERPSLSAHERPKNSITKLLEGMNRFRKDK